MPPYISVLLLVLGLTSGALATGISLDYNDEFAYEDITDTADTITVEDPVTGDTTSGEEGGTAPGLLEGEEEEEEEEEPISKVEIGKIVNTFRHAARSLGITPGQFFLKTKERMLGSKSKHSSYLGGYHGYQHETFDGDKFMIEDIEVAKIVDAILGYGNDSTFYVNSNPYLIKSSEIRRIAPYCLAGLTKGKKMALQAAGGKVLHMKIDPNFQKALRGFFRDNKYFRIDISLAVFRNASLKLVEMSTWEDVIYAFLSTPQRLFSTSVVLNDNLVVSPLKPALLALDQPGLEELLSIYMSERKPLDIVTVLLQRVGLANLMMAYQGIQQIDAYLLMLRKLEAQKHQDIIRKMVENYNRQKALHKSKGSDWEKSTTNKKAENGYLDIMD